MTYPNYRVQKHHLLNVIVTTEELPCKKKNMDSEKRGTGGKYQSIRNTNYSDLFCLFLSEKLVSLISQPRFPGFQVMAVIVFVMRQRLFPSLVSMFYGFILISAWPFKPIGFYIFLCIRQFIDVKTSKNLVSKFSNQKQIKLVNNSAGSLPAIRRENESRFDEI